MSLRYYRSEVKTKELILYFTRLIVSLENLSLNRTLTFGLRPHQVTLKNKEKAGLFLCNRYFLYVCREINDGFMGNIIGRKQEILEEQFS